MRAVSRALLWIPLTLSAYICTRPFLFPIRRLRACIAGLGCTALDRIISVISRLSAISSPCGNWSFIGEHACSEVLSASCPLPVLDSV